MFEYKPWFVDQCRHAFGLKQEDHLQWTRVLSRVNREEFVRCQVKANESYSEAKRQFSDRKRDVLMNVQSHNKWWSTLKSAVFGSSSLLPPLVTECCGQVCESVGKVDLLSDLLITKSINLQLFTLILYGVGVRYDRMRFSVLSPFIEKAMVWYIFRLVKRVFVDPSVLLRCYYSFVLPILEYCSPVGEFAADCHLQCLDRHVYSSAWRCPDQSFLSLCHRRHVAALCVLYKVNSNSIHCFVSELPSASVSVRYTKLRLQLIHWS